MPDTTVVVQAGAATTVSVTNTNETVTVPAAVSTNVTVPATITQTVTAVAQQGPPGASNFITVHTFAIGGAINVASGETDFIPPFFFQKKANQTSILKKVRHQIHSGTSATVKLQKNGADLTGFTGIVATTTPTDSGSDQALADGDVVSVVVTAVSGTPQNLTLTLVVEHTIS